MTDKVNIHISSSEIRKDILDHQVEDCPTCKTTLTQSFGLAGGGFGPYGFCKQCGKVIWKCPLNDDES